MKDWLRETWRWVTGAPEPRAIGRSESGGLSRLRKIADERGGDLQVLTLGPASYLARIEWAEEYRIYGGEGRGTTAERAATQLLLSLRWRGMI